jgi:hypothetical protein
MKKWLAAGAKSCNLGESSTALESVTRERIESVSKHFFTEIWGPSRGIPAAGVLYPRKTGSGTVSCKKDRGGTCGGVGVGCGCGFKTDV